MGKPETGNFYVVLVRPAQSLNVGSVARAMKNLGFANLRLVAPEDYRPEKALITACSADDVIGSARIFGSLHEALADMQDVTGFASGEGRIVSPACKSLFEWLPDVKTGPGVKTALLFGPEDNGLGNDELSLCRRIVDIPANQEYFSFNLAQAVLIVLWEISRLFSAVNAAQRQGREPAQQNELFQLDRLVEDVAKKSGFFRNGTPAPVPLVVKNLMRRTEPDTREVKILLGFFARIARTLSLCRDRKNSHS